MIDTEKLKDFLLALVKAPELQPFDFKTFCNIGARRVADLFGYNGLDHPDMLADAMIMTLACSPNEWTKTHFGEIAAKFAQIGGLAFAAMDSSQLGEEHWHIATIFPADCELSPSLNVLVPFVANVGEKNGIMKASEAFPVAKGQPTYFLWHL